MECCCSNSVWLFSEPSQGPTPGEALRGVSPGDTSASSVNVNLPPHKEDSKTVFSQFIFTYTNHNYPYIKQRIGPVPPTVEIVFYEYCRTEQNCFLKHLEGNKRVNLHILDR